MVERGRPRGFDRGDALEAAMHVFWSKTYEGTSMTDLTEAMGIGSPSLYAAFGSKEALFREALAHYVATRGGDMWRALDTADTKAAIAAFLDRSAAACSKKGQPPGCMVVLGAQHGWDSDDPVQRELSAARRSGLQVLRERFARGMADGDLAKTFDVKGAAAFYLAAQTGMSILARDGASRAALKAVARGAMGAWEGFSRISSPVKRGRGTAGGGGGGSRRAKADRFGMPLANLSD